ncbi:uncharacterized protein LOC127715391 isoform X2 [Mytilus californianus]|uniref:uncharacterized protein LOC127715391 isoform X2 n=1 Tax=Mytilus californianus TaxID=6549 RepID=UPI002245B63D|nr:uncharacterized protein LOC127715391 isoform X2 [Mytilus californianus]
MNGKIIYQFLFFIINTTLYGLDNAFTLHCPFNSQWKFKARGKCNISDTYQCLYDVNKLQNIESCRDRPHFEAPGYKIQIVGNLEGVQCASDRYQPFIFWTNGSSSCKFEKSICAGEGQIPFSLGTTKADSTCRCDYTQGYDFVVRPRNTCFCIPSEEDCSCFIRQCPSGFVLSPDYKCASVEELLANSQCPIPTISVEDTETQILSKNEPGYSHDYNDVPVLKIVVSVLILLVIGICCVQIIGILIIDENTSDMESLKDNLMKFKPTHASEEILLAITENPCVLITGPFGSGKTAIAYHIISRLEKEGYEITVASDPEQIVRRFHRNQRQLFLMDDILGKYSSNIPDIIAKLEKCGSAINTIFEKSDTVKVLITCRTYIFQLYAQYFESLREHVSFIHKNLIAENLRLKLEERKEIYKSYFESDPPELISDDILILYHFYPLICSSHNKEYVLEYFKHPKKIVSAEISGFKRLSDTGYLALAILVVLNNRVENKMLLDMINSKKTDHIIFKDICDESCFDQYPSKSMLLMTFTSLKGEFIKGDDTFLSFLCPELFDIVAMCIGGSFIKSILTHSSSVFIKEKLRLFSSQTDGCRHAITVQQNMEDHFYRRLTSDMNNNFIDDVLCNHLFHSAENRAKFLIHVRKQVKVKMLEDRETESNVLHIVSLVGYSDVIRHFLRYSDCPDINKKNKRGETPLHIACKNRHVRIVECLIKGGADRDIKDKDKKTALHYGCETGDINIVRLLTRNDVISINEKDAKGMAPIHIACEKGHEDVIKYLIEKKAKIDESDKIDRTPLH